MDYNNLFESEISKEIYLNMRKAINDFGMDEMISRGIVVGFSGGADSVMLLCMLMKYREVRDFKILAVHINHMIRGEEADRDEEFSRKFCEGCGIEFLSFSINVPEIAKAKSFGIEEAARVARYSQFDKLINTRDDVSAIAVAHNSTDNLETSLFNMMRGAGARGLAGISPVRDNIIRPLIFVRKKDIIEALIGAGIPFVTDSTNFEINYKRNYIRNEILPKLYVLSENPELKVQRLSAMLRDDNDYLEKCALDFIRSNQLSNGIERDKLKKLHPALLSRVILRMQKDFTSVLPQFTHIDKIRSLILTKGREPFQVSMPSGLVFVSDGDFCYLTNEPDKQSNAFFVELKEGITEISSTENALLLSYSPIDKFSSNVYKISILQTVDFDIIVGKLFARSKQDGDTYSYGNITHRLKKIFNDKKISIKKRAEIPIICDESGILFVPGFPVRDGGKKNPEKKVYIALLEKIQA